MVDVAQKRALEKRTQRVIVGDGGSREYARWFVEKAA